MPVGEYHDANTERNIRRELNSCPANKSLIVFLMNLVDLPAGLRGEGDRIWLEVKYKDTNY